jgi:hydroxyethylthiazole kinase-like uncharacterized protein yjeF
MKPLYSVAEICEIEHAAAAGLEPGTLMHRAGQAAANAALGMLESLHRPRVLLVAGPGNNGGDALETAANLALAGIAVSIIRLPGSGAPSAETARALARARASSAEFIDALPPADEWNLAIDGLFGIGLTRAIEGDARTLVETLNRLDCPVLALDVPSGLDADTGAIVGPHGIAVRATHTITFIGDKPGLHTGDGRDHAGVVRVAALGINPAHFMPASAQLNEPALFAHLFAPRPQNSNKGCFGDVAIVGGAHGMAGAPLLSARGALYAGAGRVYLAALDPGPGYDSVQPEIMFRDAASYEAGGATLVIGPGMGSSGGARRLLTKALGSDSPLVLDADALNLIAGSPELQAQLTARSAASLLTPHPLEAARLLGVTGAVVQVDRLAAAREIAARFKSVVVLKGSGSVIAAPGGAVVINTSGNPGLATAGTGDVLAGVAGSLLAQGWPLWETALGAVWLHGAAADRLVEQGVGPIGMTAGELPAAVRALLNEMVRDSLRPAGLPRS